MQLIHRMSIFRSKSTAARVEVLSHVTEALGFKVAFGKTYKPNRLSQKENLTESRACR